METVCGNGGEGRKKKVREEKGLKKTGQLRKNVKV